MNEFIISGIGGQGIITCSKLILQAALDKGYEVRSTETIGMAQRGGSVCSQVRIGKKVFSPSIPVGGADEIISMDLVEGLRYQGYLKSNGLIETPSGGIIKDKIRPDIVVKRYNLKDIWGKLGTRFNTNIIMLGIVFSNKDRYLISVEDIECAIYGLYNGEICLKNIEALHIGKNLVKEGLK